MAFHPDKAVHSIWPDMLADTDGNTFGICIKVEPFQCNSLGFCSGEDLQVIHSLRIDASVSESTKNGRLTDVKLILDSLHVNVILLFGQFSCGLPVIKSVFSTASRAFPVSESIDTISKIAFSPIGHGVLTDLESGSDIFAGQAVICKKDDVCSDLKIL